MERLFPFQFAKGLIPTINLIARTSRRLKRLGERAAGLFERMTLSFNRPPIHLLDPPLRIYGRRLYFQNSDLFNVYHPGSGTVITLPRLNPGFQSENILTLGLGQQVYSDLQPPAQPQWLVMAQGQDPQAFFAGIYSQWLN